VRMWAGNLEPPYTLKKVVSNLMQAPIYPVTLDVFQASIKFTEFKAGDTLACGLVSMRTAALNHPNGATGYRIEHGGKSICYITDTEHREGGLDKTIVELCRGADLMIYDSSYTDDEYPRYRGWGHSTWQEGVRLADAAGVGTLAIFHHDPSHPDAFMDDVAREAAAMRPGTAAGGLPRVVVAHEGLTLSP
jgi:phosphoribosyl 1,2-cyclic phosphodiesterase